LDEAYQRALIDQEERPGWKYILEFYVIPPLRRQGLGRRLFIHLAGVFGE